MKILENYWYMSVEKLLLNRKKTRDWVIANGLTALFIALIGAYFYYTTELYALTIIFFICSLVWMMNMVADISNLRWIDFIVYMKEKEGKTYGPDE